MEVCCHGAGPHPAVRVHGRVHHRHAGGVRWTADGAQHAVVRTPALKDSGSPAEGAPHRGGLLLSLQFTFSSYTSFVYDAVHVADE